MRTAVIYARYSSDAQSEQSIEGQVRVCKQYAEKNDLLIVDQYIDRALTGTNDNRAAFQQMLKDSKNRQWSVVIVYKLDRFARNKYESVVNRKKLSDNGVELVSAMENIPDTPEGKLFTFRQRRGTRFRYGEYPRYPRRQTLSRRHRRV